MEMPGGWTMSMTWMRMPGQSWTASAAMFLSMWLTMMIAMMLPSLLPMLRRYRNAVGRRGETCLGRLTALVGVGYFFVWTVFGMVAFPLAVALAAVVMQRPALARACTNHGRGGRPARWLPSVLPVEGASPCLLPGITRA
jgi:predicted metal-binding membrane protein